MRSTRERLYDIQEAIGRINKYVDLGRATFEHDELIQTWMVHHLQIIGEAIAGLPQQVRDEAAHIPWKSIVGMRNVLVHAYFAVDRNLVWNVVVRELPGLATTVQALIAQGDFSDEPQE